MTPPVVSREAEASAALLFQTLGAHRVSLARLKRAPGRRIPSKQAIDDEQIQLQATLVRLLSITEAFTAQLLMTEVDKAAARAASATIDRVWEEAAIRGTSGWKEQKDAYKKWLNVDVDWKTVERLAEARNAVAHGLGVLTRRQLRNETSVRAKLKLAGIDLSGHHLVLSDAALASAAQDCRDLITRVDLATQTRPAKYR
jgi:hypothetical protein